MADRSSPLDDIERIVEQLSTSLEQGVSEFRGGAVAVDVEERDDEYVAHADLPGYDREDVDVQVGDRHLTVRAERRTEREDREGEYVRRERRHESVSRTVDLPGPVDREAASATYRNGVLSVTLPKADEAGGHRIEIE
jgi:HSP20 family protein